MNVPFIKTDSAGSMVAGNLPMWLTIAGTRLAGRRTQSQSQSKSRAIPIRHQQWYRRGKSLCNIHVLVLQRSDARDRDRDRDTRFVNDLARIVAYTFDEAQTNLKRMMEKPGGGFDWEEEHN